MNTIDVKSQSLLRAVGNNDVEKVKQLLEVGVNVKFLFEIVKKFLGKTGLKGHKK